jgi:hypothetical protein
MEATSKITRKITVGAGEFFVLVSLTQKKKTESYQLISHNLL